MNKKDFYITDEEANQFNFTLNKIIIMCSKEYFRKVALSNTREKKIIDDEKFEENIKEKIAYEENFDMKITDFIGECENEKLCTAIEKLSVIEQSVIFLIFSKELSREEAAKILDVCVDTVSRAKIRALKKLKKYLEGDKNNG